jgi:hypothetical protein
VLANAREIALPFGSNRDSNYAIRLEVVFAAPVKPGRVPVLLQVRIRRGLAKGNLPPISGKNSRCAAAQKTARFLSPHEPRKDHENNGTAR